MAALSAAPLPGQALKVPVGFDKLETRLWREVVASLPDRWLDPAAQSVLRRAVAQSAIAESTTSPSP